ncbi:DUF4280 domain-containing protein [Paucibacter aquatile]|uniref:DUF4280 domain-containing protein n=1 Tax=Kinneretia aquatilis TaxID=2070761 RepID=A0A2N8KTG3_9BURK|nr:MULTISPECIES: DUF4280 domain-containing protein [Roseateles]PND36744.1 DUF4280 domain-containing protein [Paucibacter aquatile]
MPMHVCTGAQMMCSMGVAPAVFNATPKTVMTNNMMAGNIMDHVPMLNIPAFGMCQSIGNPSVASATAAALGALTPMPCIPNTTAPWTPGAPTVLVLQQPGLDNTCKLMCNYGGVISFVSPGQTNEMIP